MALLYSFVPFFFSCSVPGDLMIFWSGVLRFLFLFICVPAIGFCSAVTWLCILKEAIVIHFQIGIYLSVWSFMKYTLLFSI